MFDTNITTLLVKFGLAATSNADDIKKAKELFKAVFGLLPDATDDQIERAISKPRCGVSDEHLRRWRPGQPVGSTSKWNKNNIRIFIRSFVPGVDPQIQRDVVLKSFQVWSQVCNLTFELSNDPSSEIVYFSEKIDGPSNTLGVTYLPMGQPQVTMQLDSTESWDLTGRGIKLPNVIAHEAGHAIGISHPKGPGQLMSAYYDVNIGVPQSGFDIQEAVSRYGVPVVPTPPTGAPTNEIVIRCNGPITIDGYRLVKK